MSVPDWLRYPRHIAGQITVLVLTAIALSISLLIFTIVMVRPESNPEPPAQATTIDGFLGSLRLLDAAREERDQTAILNTMIRAFPNLKIATDRAVTTDNPQGTQDREIMFLRQRLGPRFRVARLPDEAGEAGRLGVGIALQDGRAIRASLPAFAPPGPPLTPIVSGIAMFVVASVSLLLLWATKALTAPLSRFAQAAEQFGPDFAHRTLPEEGPEEIRKVSRAFNQMGGRIKRLVEDRTHMLAAISHDLRTPITRLRLRADFIEDEAIRAPTLRDVEQMNQMIDAALAFIRDTRMEDSLTTVELPALLQTICDQFVEMGENVSYQGPDRLLAAVRPFAFQRAVTNLVQNAVKFGSSAVIELRSEPEGAITIDIADDGPGLADTDPQKLLAAFVRGDAARTMNDQSGFGLGLTIAHSVIEAHGGQLTFCNRQPRGLTVRLTLPVDRGPHPQ
jgi:signal transduction histidine kinase